jgi:hypothetical protein
MGSGPGQLSLALLADVTGDDKLAQRYYLQFKQEVIARLEHEKPWEISEHQIKRWLVETGAWEDNKEIAR